MSNNTTAAPSLIPSLESSLAVLTRNFIPCFLWIPLGLLGAITSALVIITFFNKKPESLRSNYFMNVMHIAAADLFMALVHLFIGLKRSILLWTAWGEVSTPLRCIVDMGCIQASQVASAGQIVAMAIDRLLAVAFPSWYHKRSRQYSAPINIFFWILSVLSALVMYAYMNRAPWIPTCSVGYVYRKSDPDYWDFQTLVQQALLAATFVIYGLFVILLWFRRKKVLKTALSETARKKNNRGNRLAGALVLLYIVTWLLAAILDAAINAWVEPSQRIRWFPYEPLFALLSLPGNFVLYWIFDADFRAALRKLAGVETSQVSHSGSSAMLTSSQHGTGEASSSAATKSTSQRDGINSIQSVKGQK